MDEHPLKPHEWSLEITFGAISTVPGTAEEPPVALLSGEGNNIKITTKPIRGCAVPNGTHFETLMGNGTKIISISRVQESGKTPVEGDWMSFSGRFWPTLKDLQMVFEIEGESKNQEEVTPFEGFVYGHGRSLFSAAAACGALDSVALPKNAGEQDFLESLRLDGQAILPIIRKYRPSDTPEDSAAAVNPMLGFLSLRWQLIRGYYPSWSPSIALDILAPSLVGAGAIPDSGIPETTEDPDSKSIPYATANAAHTISDTSAVAHVPEDQIDVRVRTQLVRTPHPCADRSFWRERTRISGHRGCGADNAAIVKKGVGTNPDAPAENTDGTYRRTHVLENSLLSFANAARSGLDFIELDVHISRDGVPVIHHDWGVKLPRGLANPGQKQTFPKRLLGGSTTASAAGGTPGSNPGSTSGRASAKTFFSPQDDHCESTPLRVPITHLTVAQLKSMTPQPAAGEGPDDDEYRVPKAADQQATLVRVNPTARTKNKAAKDLALARIPPHDTPMPYLDALETRSDCGDASCTGDNGLLSPSGSVDSSFSTFSTFSSASTPLSLKYTKLDKHKHSFRAMSALGVDDFSFQVRARHQNSPRADLGLVDPNGFATLEEVLSLPEFAPPGTAPPNGTAPKPPCGINIEVKYPTLAETRLFGLRSIERNAFVHAILDVLFASPCVQGAMAPGADGSSQLQHAGIPIMFSSFDPDICLLLQRKQAAFPVFFLTEGGTQSEDFADSRWNSLDAAIAWASRCGFAGVVSHTPPILKDPVGIVNRLYKEHNLLLATYGKCNNRSTAVKAQVEAGVAVVICDHVNYILDVLGRLPKRTRDTAKATEPKPESKTFDRFSPLSTLLETATDAAETSSPLVVSQTP